MKNTLDFYYLFIQHIKAAQRGCLEEIIYSAQE